MNNDPDAGLVFTAASAEGSTGRGLIEATHSATTQGPVSSATLVSAGANNDLVLEGDPAMRSPM